MVQLENAPDNFSMTLTGIRVGDIAFIGIPGEPFSLIGNELKETEGYRLILPSCITNGYQGYFPSSDAYREGGYESRSSTFGAGVAESIVKGVRALLAKLR